MPRALFMMASAVLLVCAGLLLVNARESEASAHAVTKACTDAARLSGVPLFGHCTYVQRWDVDRLAFGGIALAGGLSILAFSLSRKQTTV
jgi:hypothetical protein